MLTFGTPDPGVLDVVGEVVQRLRHDTDIAPSQVMVVGAHARNIIHSGLGDSAPIRLTDDVDLALALPGWDAYQPITKIYPRLGDSQMRYRVGGIPVDFMPFGPRVEEPPGAVTPPPRKEAWTVAGFQDVHRHAQAVEITPQGDTVRVPSPAGYTALKLRSWADRAPNHDTKDAQDLAVACHWYTESEAVRAELYETGHGQNLLEVHNYAQDLAAVALLSYEVSEVLSAAIATSLAADLKNVGTALLSRDFTTSLERFPSTDRDRREAMITSLLSALV